MNSMHTLLLWNVIRYLDGVFDQVLLAPIYLDPGAFIKEHERSFENGVSAGNPGGDRQIFANQDGHGQRICNREESPDKSLGQGSTSTVTACLSSLLALVHETLANKHGNRLGKEIRSDHLQGRL